MLTQSKAINFSGSITVDGAVVVDLSYSIQDNGTSNYSEYVRDKQLYDDNKATILQEIEKFKTNAEA